MSVITIHHANDEARRGTLRGDLRILNIALIVVVVGLFVGYLVVNNLAASSGFAVRSLEKHITTLENQRRHLDLVALERQAMQNIETKAQALGFVPVDGIDFVTGTGGSMALK